MCLDVPAEGRGSASGYCRPESAKQIAEAVRDAAHEHDARLVADGAQMGVAGKPVQVRNHDGRGVKTAKGPYLKSDLPIAGFALIEAESLEEAIELASKTPCAVAQGVVEVWPLETPPN